MTAPQQFSLRWNNYSQHIVTALDDLRADDELTDVTLSCEGQRLKAHKVLLAACSSFFRDTFKVSRPDQMLHIPRSGFVSVNRVVVSGKSLQASNHHYQGC